MRQQQFLRSILFVYSVEEAGISFSLQFIQTSFSNFLWLNNVAKFRIERNHFVARCEWRGDVVMTQWCCCYTVVMDVVTPWWRTQWRRDDWHSNVVVTKWRHCYTVVTDAVTSWWRGDIMVTRWRRSNVLVMTWLRTRWSAYTPSFLTIQVWILWPIL